MIVGATGDDAETFLRKTGRERLRVLDDVGRVLAKIGPARFAEGNGLGRDHVHQRSTLQPGEHRLVDSGRVVAAREDRTRARPAQGLVGRERDDVGQRHRRGMRATRDQTGDMRGVDEEKRADLVGDRPERLEIDDPRVRRGSGDDHPRTFADREVADHAVVEHLGVVVDAVRDEVVHTPAEVDRRPVREVAALVEAHPHHLVAGLEQRHERGLIRVRARVGLHIGVLRAEEGTGTIAREVLGVIDHEVAAVVTLRGVTLGVLVGKHRALRFEHRSRREVLRRDELDRGVLSFELAPDDVGDLGVGVLQG